jgi:hypothetical protein
VVVAVVVCTVPAALRVQVVRVVVEQAMLRYIKVVHRMAWRIQAVAAVVPDIRPLE